MNVLLLKGKVETCVSTAYYGMKSCGSFIFFDDSV